MDTNGEATGSGRAFLAGPDDDPDRYSLGSAVAAGNEGVLYRGTRTVGDVAVEVAIKMLHPGHHGSFDAWARRWQEQATLLENLAAPGLVRVRESFVGPLPHVVDGADPSTRSLYLVMDWIDGEPLWEWAAARPDASAEQLLVPLVSVGATLDLMHSGAATNDTPLLHGDVKPGNILVVHDGTTVLVDLGSVRMFDANRQSGVTGTQGYRAPEVVHRGQWSVHADRYALGWFAIALLSGVEPPVGADHADLRRLLVDSPRSANRGELVDHVLEMVADDPLDRPSDCANWVAQLRRSSLVLTPADAQLPPLAPSVSRRKSSGARRSSPRRRVALVLAPVVLVAAATLAAVLLTRGNDGDGSPDWANTTYDAGTCATTEPTRMVDGKAANGIRLLDHLHGQIDDDTTPDDVVLLQCSSEGPAIQELQVWQRGSGDTRRLLTARDFGRCSYGSTPENEFNAYNGCQAADITKLVDLQARKFRIQEHRYVADDPICCPSLTVQLTYRVRAGQLDELAGKLVAEPDSNGALRRGRVLAAIHGRDWDASAIATPGAIQAAKAMQPCYPLENQQWSATPTPTYPAAQTTVEVLTCDDGNEVPTTLWTMTFTTTGGIVTDVASTPPEAPR